MFAATRNHRTTRSNQNEFYSWHRREYFYYSNVSNKQNYIRPDSWRGRKLNVTDKANLKIGIPSFGRLLTWTFVIVNITNPPFGLEFFNEFGQTIDYSNRTIYGALTARKRNLKTATFPVNLVINEIELPSRNTQKSFHHIKIQPMNMVMFIIESM